MAKKKYAKTTWNKQKRKKRQKSPTQKAKEKAWKAFSRYIRLRDCLDTTGEEEEGICIKCGERKPFKGLQAGHAIPGRNNSILLDEELVYAQCAGCNLFGGGRVQNKFTLFIIRKFGVEFYEEKVKLSEIPQKMTCEEWEERRKYFEDKTEELDKKYKL